ncbi:MAG: hypothetical protein A2583_16310 [Bdellovibrionales bacterium RIFOXYD1_FULL_53_11]|nr:MAG: hypothetical protein A2583_16310 [Bdellovibrionales bacterium RIFOXYD1_FULL_53_11]
MVKEKAKKILIGLSGGIDSAVAAGLLKRQGYMLSAVLIRMKSRNCAPVLEKNLNCHDDPEVVKTICKKLEIPFNEVDASEVFNDKVIDYFIHQKLLLRSSDICSQCNSEIIFKYLLDIADSHGIDIVATGHYAQIVHDTTSGLVRLCRAAEAQKDQSHQMLRLGQGILKRIITPVGSIPYSMVLKLAAEFGFDKLAEGHRLCFGDFSSMIEFMESRTAQVLWPKGVIRTLHGNVVGEHAGLFKYRIGQEDDLPLNQFETASGLKVIAQELVHQALIVGEDKHLAVKEITCNETMWLRSVEGLRAFKVKARIAGRPEEKNCRIFVFENDTVQILFDEPVFAPCYGEEVVFYDDDEIMGGARISKIKFPFLMS